MELEDAINKLKETQDSYLKDELDIAIETVLYSFEQLKKENEELRKDILRLEKDSNNLEELESTIKELEEYIVKLEYIQEGLHDVNNFKRELEIKGLMTEQLDEFIENYMRWSNG